MWEVEHQPSIWRRSLEIEYMLLTLVNSLESGFSFCLLKKIVTNTFFLLFDCVLLVDQTYKRISNPIKREPSSSNGEGKYRPFDMRKILKELHNIFATSIRNNQWPSFSPTLPSFLISAGKDVSI